MHAQFDMLIRGGTIVDGSGGKPYVGDVAIRDGVIVAVGDVAGTAAEDIDAAGLLVTPGFVDIHTHYDGQVTWEKTLAPSSGHGVTTVVMGNCGVGFAPARPAQRQILIDLMEGVEDVPGVVMQEGVPWNWQTFPEYLDALDKRETDIDFAAFFPHSPLRVWVMGERGARMEPPSAEDLEQMRKLTAEAMQVGALGVSTSRSIAHRFPDGSPAPSVNTELQELQALAQGLRDADDGVFQLNPNPKTPPEKEFGFIRTIAETAQRPVTFSLVPNDDFSAGWTYMKQGMADAAKDGLTIQAQMLPRPIGGLFGLDLAFHPFSLNPSYRKIADLPLAEKVAAMKDPEFRAQLISEEPDSNNDFLVWVVTHTNMLFPLGDPPNYLPRPEDSIKARAERAGIDEREALYDELLKDDGHAVIYHPLGKIQDGRFDAATDLFDQPNVLFGLGDGGAHYGSVCDAATSTFVLQQYVRGGSGSDFRLPVETAVRMLARDTAEAVGLRDRGLLKPGYKADVNLIDLDSIHLHAPRIKHDLPAGGKRLTQRADGYVATIVSGQTVYRNGEATGKFPGRLVRHTRSDPEALLEAAE